VFFFLGVTQISHYQYQLVKAHDMIAAAATHIGWCVLYFVVSPLSLIHEEEKKLGFFSLLFCLLL
jgi:hypothetical protein